MTQAQENSRFRSRRFFITFWKKVDMIEAKNLVYGCQCFDQCSEEHGGKFHGHAFLYFKNAVSINTIKKHYGNECHNEAIKTKSNSDCIKYIMDPEHKHAAHKFDRVEVGEKPCDNGHHLTADQALKMDDGEILDLNARDAAMVYNLKEKLKTDDLDIDDFEKKVKVYYIWGPSGVGKTEKAKEIIRENGRKFANAKYDGHFWSGIKNHKAKVILVDDFRDSQMKASEFINLIDYNKHTMNIKNGSEMNDFEVVIITSVQSPYDIYKKMADEPRKQWLRRMEKIDLTPKENPYMDETDYAQKECEDCEL